MTSQNSIQYFAEHWDSYDRFTNKVSDLIYEMIEDIGLDVAQINARTKSVESFREKLARPDKNYRNPIKDVTDLCGVRIVCYFNEDVDFLCERIRKLFDVDEKASIDKAPKPTELGYRSKHLIVRLGTDRDNLPEYRHFRDMKAEVQVRTIGQHAWAAIEHKFNYKRENNISEEVERRLFRISAVLEICDDEFSRIKSEIDKITTNFNVDINHGNLKMGVTVESLIAYMDSSPESYETFTASLRARGLRFRKRSLTSHNAFDIAVKQLRKAGIDTIENLDHALAENAKNFIDPIMRIFSGGDSPIISQAYLLRIFASFYKNPKSIDETIKRFQATSTVRRTVSRKRGP